MSNGSEAEIDVREVKPGAVFTKIGRMFKDLSYSHLRLDLSFQDIILRRNGLMTMNDKFQNGAYPESFKENSRKRMNYLKKLVNDSIQDEVLKLNTTLKAFNVLEDSKVEGNLTPDVNLRSKRQLISGIAAGIAGGLISSVISSFTKDNLIDIIKEKEDLIIEHITSQEAQLANHEKDLKGLKIVAKKLYDEQKRLFWKGKSISTEQHALFLTYILSRTSIQIEKIISGINRAQSGSFSLDLVNIKSLEKAFKNLQQKTASKGRKLSITSIFDLPHLPLSFVFDPDSKQLILLIHIPTTKNEGLTIFEFVHLPIKMKNDHYISFEPENNFIMVDDSRTFYVEKHDLSNCHRLHEIYYCPDQLSYKKSRKSCLSTLYFNDPSSIEKCDAHLSSELSKAHRINDTSFLILESNKSELNINCNNHNVLTKSIQGTYVVDVDKGCIATTDNLIVTRPPDEPSIDIESHLSIDQFDFKLFESETDEFISSNIFKTFETKIPMSQIKSLVKFKKAIDEINAKQRKQPFNFNISTLTPGAIYSSLVTIASCLLIVVFCKCLLTYICKRNKNPQPSNTFQSMSMSNLRRRLRRKNKDDTTFTTNTDSETDTVVEEGRVTDNPAGSSLKLPATMKR